MGEIPGHNPDDEGFYQSFDEEPTNAFSAFLNFLEEPKHYEAPPEIRSAKLNLPKRGSDRINKTPVDWKSFGIDLTPQQAQNMKFWGSPDEPDAGYYIDDTGKISKTGSGASEGEPVPEDS